MMSGCLIQLQNMMNMIKVTKKKKQISGLLLVFVLFGLLIFTGLSGRNTYSYDLVRYESGWGYDIKKEGNVIIRQEFVPGVAGKQGFSQKSDARIVARQVIYKLQNGNMPTIQAKELSELID
ncbi:DUF4907 domain-containing protein [Marinilabiliaceae bacterium JC017]|nr:DUF4907 domain-containing protein [Marinilabiliaceae bacterium JC017]